MNTWEYPTSSWEISSKWQLFFYLLHHQRPPVSCILSGMSFTRWHTKFQIQSVPAFYPLLKHYFKPISNFPVKPHLTTSSSRILAQGKVIHRMAIKEKEKKKRKEKWKRKKKLSFLILFLFFMLRSRGELSKCKLTLLPPHLLSQT